MIATLDLNTREGVLSQLLTGAMESIDLPADLDAHGRWRFGDIGNYLRLHGDAQGGAPWEIYPQGAFLLGTVIAPIDEGGDFDVDLVCRRDIDPGSTTRMGLKADTGSALVGYQRIAILGPLALKEGRRCWTLREPQRTFHADILPAIPDPNGTETGILITDREYSRWLQSDPKAFAAWFQDRMALEYLALARKMAEARGSTVEEIPSHLVKTTLQRSVQALKRHRDIYFAERVELSPPSVLLTTLAAWAYPGGRNLFETVVVMADTMPDYIEREGLSWSVPNPVQPNENFADRWRQQPGLRQAFLEWIEALKRDLDEIQRVQGMKPLSERIGRSFGERAIQKGVESLGRKTAEMRDAGKLAMSTTTGALTSITTPRSRPVRRHGFFGDVEDPAE